MPTQGTFAADTLTELLHKLVLEAPSGKPPKVIASLVGKGHVTLLNELNPGQDRNKFDADMVLPLCNAIGSNEPVRWLARQMGLAVIELPDAAPGDSCSCDAALKAVEEFGEVMGAFRQARADGVVDRWEAREIRKQGHEAVEQILALLEVIELEQEA